MSIRRLSLLLPLPLAAACGDNVYPPTGAAALRDADPAVLSRAVAGASGADAREALALARSYLEGNQLRTATCPAVDAGDAVTTISFDCADGTLAGTILVEHALPHAPAPRTRVTFLGYRDADRGLDGFVEETGAAGSLAADLDVTIDDVAIRSILALACDAQGVCAAAPDAMVDIDGLGAATVAGAWRQAPLGGSLTLIGLETMTFDLNAAAQGCVPYTIDGAAAGELCDDPVVP